MLDEFYKSKKIETKSRPFYFDEWIENCANLLLRGARATIVAAFAIVMFIGVIITLILQHPNAYIVDTQFNAMTENAWDRDATARNNQAPRRDDRLSADQQAEELRSQLSQATTEQLKASQVWTSQLEAELNQRPTRDDLHSAQLQADELRSQLREASEQLKAFQVRTSQLEAELNQRPSRDDLNSAQLQADELRSQLREAAEQFKASHVRNSQLEAELNQRPSRDDLDSAQLQADQLRSQLNQLTERLKASQVRTSQLEAELEEYRRAAQLTLLERGDSLLSSGDITSARLFYQRAAEAGNAEAALRLGETYDPAFLHRVQLRDHGDSSQALFWYGRARELGATDADVLLKGIETK